MPATVLVGCQWGDEGKGKIVDLLAERTDWVARYSGGPNAGHTVKVGDETFVLHLIPSGILRPSVRCVIGNGVVVDLDYLVQEIEELERRGIRTKGRLFLSSAAHLLLPYHRWLEGIEGQDVRVGTTKRGIGPAYQDKMGRMGLRLHDILDRDHLRDRLDQELARVEALHRMAGRKMPESRAQAREAWSRHYHEIGRALGGAITDTVTLLHEALDRGERVLCEGSQGTFLDIDLGSYPYVTSASTTAGGAATGSGSRPIAARQGDRYLEGIHHARRQWPVSDGISGEAVRAVPQARRGVRGHDGTPASMRLARHGGAPPCGPGQRVG